MSRIIDITLDELWDGVCPGSETFDPARVAHLPEPAQRYLLHAIAPGTRLASAVRLTMSGDIKLGDRWLPFEAEQVICWDRGMIWKAKAKMGLLSIRGSDRIIDGEGAMRWKLFGIIPVMKADGPDITRSAAGRLQIESMWLPSVLLPPRLPGEPTRDVVWHAEDRSHPHVSLTAQGEHADIELTIDERGAVLAGTLARWGNPEGGAFHHVPFGGYIDAELECDGYTVPSQLRVGWYAGTERYEKEGEFWRATIHSARFR